MSYGADARCVLKMARTVMTHQWYWHQMWLLWQSRSNKACGNGPLAALPAVQLQAAAAAVWRRPEWDSF